MKTIYFYYSENTKATIKLAKNDFTKFVEFDGLHLYRKNELINPVWVKASPMGFAPSPV
jgi:hypothetical protein